MGGTEGASVGRGAGKVVLGPQEEGRWAQKPLRPLFIGISLGAVFRKEATLDASGTEK